MFLISSRTLRAFGFAAASIALVLPTMLAAAPAQPRAQADAAEMKHEPFGDSVMLPAGGGVLAKWLGVWRRWNDGTTSNALSSIAGLIGRCARIRLHSSSSQLSTVQGR
jgi:hypothetical protein